MTTQDIKVRIGLEGAEQVQAGAARASQAMGALDAGTRRFAQGAQITGQQTAQLSAQLQDFFVQVQAGGSPLTAFLQQGSQLSAVFGGAGNALRAVTSLITPTVAAFGAAAAAIGTVGFAYARGEAERLAFERGIITTGNAAGVTAGQLAELARAAQSYGATQGSSSDVLAQLVATGRVAGTVLGQAAEAAVRLEREGVASVKDTVAAFAELGKSPLQALLRLNDTQNFLTLSTYRQVKALQDAGRETEAARLAQEAYATAGIARGKELEQSVGSIAQAWRTVTREVRAAIDAIADIGRAKSPEDAVADIDRRLAQLQLRRQTGRRIDSNTVGDLISSQDEIEREAQALIKLRAQIQAGVETQRQLAAAQAQRTAETKRQIEADKRAAEAAKKLAEALRRQREEQIAAGVAQARGGGLQDAGFQADFLEKYRQLQAALNAGAISMLEFERAQQRLIQQQPVMIEQQQDIARAISEANAVRERELKAAEASAKSAEEQVEALRQQYVEITAGKYALREYIDLRLQDALATAEQVLYTKQLLGEDAAVLALAQRNVQALREQIALRREIAAATDRNDAAEVRRKVEEEDASARQRLYDDYRNGLTEAFRGAFLKGGDFARNFARGLAAEVQARLASALATTLADAVLRLGLGVALEGGGGAGSAGGGGSLLQGASNAKNLYDWYNKAAAWWNGSGSAASASTYASTLGSLSWATPNYSLGSSLSMSQGGAYLGSAQFGVGGSAQGVVGTGNGLALAEGASTTAAGASSWGWASTNLYTALAALALGINLDAYSKGFRQQDFDSRFFENIGGPAANRAVLDFLGFNDKWSNVLSGASGFGYLFGRSAPRVEAMGVTGTVTGGDFTGQFFEDVLKKGGVFRSDKRWTELSALPDDLGRFLDDGAAKVLASVQDFGKALGLPGEELARVTTDLRVELFRPTDSTKEAIAEATRKNLEGIAEALEGYGDQLVSAWADKVAPLAQYGESAAQTIQRVGGAIIGINDVLKALGLTALQASVAGGEAALGLQKLFGDLGTFQQAAGGYLQNFYSEQERTDLALKSIGEQLAAVGLAVPGTRDAFRGLVEAQDLTTESGRKAFTALLGVADAFAAITPSADDAAKASGQLADTIGSFTDRFLGESERVAAQYQRVADRLSTLGVNIPAQSLLDATREQVRDWVLSFVQIGSASAETKQAVVELASSLLDLKEGAAGSAKAFAASIDGIYAASAGGRATTASGAIAQAERVRDFRQLQAALNSEAVRGGVERFAQRQRQYFVDLNAAQFAVGRGTDPASYEPPPVNLDGVANYLAGEYLLRQQESAQDLARSLQEQEQRTAANRAALLQSNQDLVRALTGLTTSLVDYRRELISGSLSAFSPEAQYETARAEFRAIASQALVGDQAAREQLQARSADFLELSRSYYGGGAGFAADNAQVLDVLNRVLEMLGTINGNTEAGINVNLQGLARVADATQGTTAAVRTQAERALLLAQRVVE